MLSYDQIGVTIRMNPYGKYSAKLVFINDDKIVGHEEVAKDRSLPAALREIRTAVDRISLRLSRKELVLTQPQVSKVQSE